MKGILPTAVALARTLEAETDRALAIVGLTARGFLALREISSGRATTQRDLARRLHLEPSTTCELLARLARRRLVAPGVAARGVAARGVAARGVAACGVVVRGATSRTRRRAEPPTLTPAGTAALERAERVVALLEREWARRMRAARGSAGNGWIGPIYGLRRWLGEGLASIAGTAGTAGTAGAAGTKSTAARARPR